MNTLIHADIFFFISTIWVIIISAIVVVILWNVACIMNDAKHISRKIREGGDALSEDLSEFRDAVHTEGAKFKHVTSYFKSLFAHRRSHKK